MAREVAAAIAAEPLVRSPALRQLLVYLAKRYPERESAPTTEYAIAQDVLQKGAGFDPSSDPVVRMRVRRLRAALDQIYADRGTAQRLVIPPRSYDLELAPGNETGEKTGARRPPARRGLAALAAVFAVALVALGFGWGWLEKPQPAGYPLVRVLPIENLTGDPAKDIFQRGLQRQLASDLQRFSILRAYASGDEDESDADFTLKGQILAFDEDIDLTFSVEAGMGGTVIYSGRVQDKVMGGDYFAAISEITAQISGRIASRGGGLREDADAVAEIREALLAQDGITPDVFRCVVLEDRFFADYQPARFTEAFECFEPLLPRMQDYAFAMSSWGTLIQHSVPEFDMMRTEGLPERMRHTAPEALALAQSIADRFPYSSEAFLLLGSVESAMGRFEQADVTLRQAARLNPGDATTRAVLSYLVLAQDDFDPAIAQAEEAIALSANPPGYIFLPIVIAALAEEDAPRAMEAARDYLARRGGPETAPMRLILARLEGDDEAVRRLSPQVAAMERPLAGFSRYVQGPSACSALDRVLPEAQLACPATP
ncbi:hypothetical protein [Roseovarius aquimarinus]|uniref:Tetratricopeptide repeat protein n=1 Tax=Roseovarius aquimarinus TaxID=1229156 RepID=A0ABW7I657_9RHOB